MHKIRREQNSKFWIPLQELLSTSRVNTISILIMIHFTHNAHSDGIVAFCLGWDTSTHRHQLSWLFISWEVAKTAQVLAMSFRHWHYWLLLKKKKQIFNKNWTWTCIMQWHNIWIDSSVDWNRLLCQGSAAVHSGASGGILVNRKGQLIGLVTCNAR